MCLVEVEDRPGGMADVVRIIEQAGLALSTCMPLPLGGDTGRADSALRPMRQWRVCGRRQVLSAEEFFSHAGRTRFC